MNLAFSPRDELYLVYRNGVILLHDHDNDGVCESQTKVLELQTPGDYPHNGLGGIVFSADGWPSARNERVSFEATNGFARSASQPVRMARFT